MQAKVVCKMARACLDKDLFIFARSSQRSFGGRAYGVKLTGWSLRGSAYGVKLGIRPANIHYYESHRTVESNKKFVPPPLPQTSMTAPTYFHGRTGRNKLGGRKEICSTFSDCARGAKKNFPDKLSKIVVDGGGGGKSDYEKFLLDSIFPTKLTEFVPFIFIISQYCPTVKRILPDWLCLPNKLVRYAHAYFACLQF
jgi:hypothetical protein